ncbi:MAG: hypothetical protein JSU94_03955 [Phycisphaerales bacterium]|nr:MAG: hypothetical protein JSU94_03955 [Phycisphaerales bacterium]
MPKGTVGAGLCPVTIFAFVCLGALSPFEGSLPEKDKSLVSFCRAADRLDSANQTQMEVLPWL